MRPPKDPTTTKVFLQRLDNGRYRKTRPYGKNQFLISVSHKLLAANLPGKKHRIRKKNIFQKISLEQSSYVQFLITLINCKPLELPDYSAEVLASYLGGN